MDCGTILVVDSDDAFRSAAVRIAVRLGLDACALENGELLLERLDDLQPVLAIVEVELQGPSSGLELLRELHERFGDELPVILVSAERTSALDRVAGLMLGADDYVTKPVDPGELLARVRRSLRRSGVAVKNGNGNGNGKPTRDFNLSRREAEILALLAEGQTQAQIATALVVSPKTVATHIQHLLAKLGVHSRAQAVALAFRVGLVDTDAHAHAFEVEPVPAV